MKKNNYLNYVIIGLVVVIIGVAVIFLYSDNGTNSKKYDNPYGVVFKLKGEERITHNLNDLYTDLGVVLEGDNIDIINDLTTQNNVNANEEGNYTVVYKYKDLVLTRYVEVKKINSFKLLGNEKIYLVTNGKYFDEKIEAINNSSDVSNEVNINNNLDSSKNGNYTITYTLNSQNKTLIRYIYVSDFSSFFVVNYDKSDTDGEITLDIKIDKDKVSKYIMPDNSEKQEDSSYIVKENGEYKFIIYDKYDNSLERIVNITNIKEKEVIESSCEAIASFNKTEITVKSNKKITKYIYNGNTSTESTFTFNKMIKENKVVIYDEDNQHETLTCKTEIDNTMRLEIHFIATGFYDDGILIRSNNATIFMDGGRGAERVVEYLKNINVSTIDYVIGSHTEYDHIDAQGAVIRTFDVKNVIYPNDIRHCGCSCEANDVRSVINALSAKKMSPKVVGVPSKIQVGDMTLYFIAPFSIGCNKNNNSFIFILQFGNTKFMFTGDADSALNNINKLQENAVKAGLTDISADVFKYPHHGNQMLGNTFIKTINPKYIIVPNYNAPKYGGPVAGVPAYRQSDSKTGNILVTSDGNEVKVQMDVNPTDYAW